MVGFNTPLPLAVPQVVGGALVVKRAFASSPRLQAVLDGLSRRASQLAQGLPDVELVWPLKPLSASLSPA